MCMAAISPLGSALFGGGSDRRAGLAMLSPAAALFMPKKRTKERTDILYPNEAGGAPRYGRG